MKEGQGGMKEGQRGMKEGQGGRNERKEGQGYLPERDVSRLCHPTTFLRIFPLAPSLTEK
jgi:hypothetical protein